MNRSLVFNLIGIVLVMALLLYFVLYAGFRHGHY